MKHHASRRFRECYDALPEAVRRVADTSFEQLRRDPRHPSLHFKKIRNLWSARVGMHHRALGIDVPGGILWIWIGSHADYDRLVR